MSAPTAPRTTASAADGASSSPNTTTLLSLNAETIMMIFDAARTVTKDYAEVKAKDPNVMPLVCKQFRDYYRQCTAHVTMTLCVSVSSSLSTSLLNKEMWATFFDAALRNAPRNSAKPWNIRLVSNMYPYDQLHALVPSKRKISPSHVHGTAETLLMVLDELIRRGLHERIVLLKIFMPSYCKDEADSKEVATRLPMLKGVRRVILNLQHAYWNS